MAMPMTHPKGGGSGFAPHDRPGKGKPKIHERQKIERARAPLKKKIRAAKRATGRR